HIVAGGSSLCQGGTLTYTYITELWFLDEFATSVLGYPIDVMSGYDATTQSGTSLHSDNPPKTIDMNGKSMFTGDVYVWEPNTVDNNSDNGSDSDKGSGDDDSKNRDLPVVTSPQPVSSTSSSKPFATNDSNDDKSKSDKTSNDKDSDDPNDSNDDNDKSTKQDLDDNGDETTEDEMAMGEKETSMLTETKYISGDKTSNEDSTYPASNHTYDRRAIAASELANVRGGLLFKNSKQTSCEIGLISMKAGFVAASCFDYTSGTNINRSTKYEVYLQTGSPTPLVVTLDPSDIHLHPNYNPSTLQNNIAVIQFNKQTTDPYKAYVLTNRFMVSTSAYVRRTINTSTGKWNNNISADMINNPNDCLNYSGLFLANIGQFVCTPLATTSMYNPSCTVPYGTVYAKGKDGMIALVAVHSFTVATSSSLCQGGLFSYSLLTQLWDLDTFATSVLGYPIDVMVDYEPGTQTGTSLYSNNPPKAVDMSGKTVFTGDVYALQNANANSNTNNSGSNSSNNSSSDGGKDDSSDNPPVVASPQPASTSSSPKPSVTNDSNGNSSNTKDDKDTQDKDEIDEQDQDEVKNTNDNKGSTNNGGSNNEDKVTDDDSSTENSEIIQDEIVVEDENGSLFTETVYLSGDEFIDQETYKSMLAANRESEKDESDKIANQQANSSEPGMNKTQIIVISIVVPVVALLLAFIAFLIFRAWKSRQVKEKWDPLAEANQHRNAIFDLGGVDDDTVTPPPYVRHSESSTSLNTRSLDYRENGISKDEKS
ncbi:hypothetical protein H4R99_006203, partial [Coemansia sp. RSA 1722]